MNSAEYFHCWGKDPVVGSGFIIRCDFLVYGETELSCFTFGSKKSFYRRGYLLVNGGAVVGGGGPLWTCLVHM